MTGVQTCALPIFSLFPSHDTTAPDTTPPTPDKTPKTQEQLKREWEQRLQDNIKTIRQRLEKLEKDVKQGEYKDKPDEEAGSLFGAVFVSCFLVFGRGFCV